MDDKELEVGASLVMLVDSIHAVTTSDNQVTFYYKGLSYSFHDLAILVEWYAKEQYDLINS